MNSSRKSMMAGIGASIGILVLSVSAGAGAFEGETVKTTAPAARETTVAYGDLDLGSPAGQATLAYRIERAAREVCGATDLRRAGSLALATRNSACVEQAVNAATRKVPRPMVATAE
ncbi:MAG: UrcA family protein [Pseudohaliea sp.]